MTWGENNSNNNPFDDAKEKMKKVFSTGGKNNGLGASSMLVIIVLLLLGWAATGFYIVEQDEQAVVMRFGKFARIADPGLNYHLPFPAENIIKHKVTVHQIEEFGYRSNGATPKTAQDFFKNNNVKRVTEESLMLTGDENIVDINFFVRWKIGNIKDYSFNVKNPRNTVQMAAESAVREVIGSTEFTVAQTQGRSQVEQRSKELLQIMLDSYNAGITILNLQMLKIDPPQQVIDAFRDVQTARADRERLINQAIAYKNDLLPTARGKADKIIKGAEAYYNETIAKAEGEASRYSSVYQKYILAKNVTKERIYIETMENIYKNIDKVLIDQHSNSLLPMLPLNDLQKMKNNK